MDKLTPQQALNILIQATAKSQADRDSHLVIQQALDVIKDLIKKNESKSVDPLP